MNHLGDITKIIGSEAPVVDVVIGGSPCQNLSIAGNRSGLSGEQSGLYMEQIRIIKEMREADVLCGKSGVDVRPRYMVWENVPGAFSTNGGKDFAAVLEEAIRVAEPKAPNIPVPKKGWPTCGCFWDELGGWSIAWRVLDAQFWGVPQRRRRIALVADFGGLSAPEILFVRKSVSGNIDQGKPHGKETTGDAGKGSAGAGRSVISVDQGGGKSGANSYDGVSPTLTCTHGGEPAVTYADVAATLRAGAGAPKHISDFVGRLVSQFCVVRRITPLEGERLQGYPDGWTDIGEWTDSKGKKHKPADTPRYKALGNSIAIPPWKWVLKRLCACYERDATMASLFDGIGGFPYIWEQLNGKGSCLWASEIEEFPMAVTKLRFGG